MDEEFECLNPVEEDIITKEIADLAEKCGYPFRYVNIAGIENVPTNLPNLSLMHKWVRDILDVDVFVITYKNITTKEKLKLYEVVVEDCSVTCSGYSTYEEALKIGLVKALKRYLEAKENDAKRTSNN